MKKLFLTTALTAAVLAAPAFAVSNFPQQQASRQYQVLALQNVSAQAVAQQHAASAIERNIAFGNAQLNKPNIPAPTFSPAHFAGQY